MAGDRLLGIRIRARLDEMGYSQTWLARRVNKEQSTVSRWIDGTRSVTTPDLRLLSRVLRRSPAWLLDDSPSAEPQREEVTA
jgi:transcriptional regulator with XRE-family HTH domain